TTYEIRIDFEASGLASEQIVVFANEQIIGEFPIQPSVLELTDFPIFESDEITLIICEAGNENCCDTLNIIQQDCDTVLECSITSLTVDVLDCNTDTTFAISAQFAWENISGSGVDVYSGSEYLGFYPLQVPLEIPDFPSNLIGNYELK